MSAHREMNLREWVETLAPMHPARKELDKLEAQNKQLTQSVQEILISDVDASVKEATRFIVTKCDICGELKLGGQPSP